MSCADRDLGEKLVAVTGFRSLATHDDQKLRFDVVGAIAQGRIEALRNLARLMIEAHPGILPPNPGT